MNQFWYDLAGVALTLHGLVEVAPLFSQKMRQAQAGQAMPKFIFEPLQNNLRLATWLGGIFGVVRFIAALGIFLSLMWGLALGVIISVVTFIVMTIYLPWGLADGVLSGIALVSLLIGYFGGQRMP